MVKMAVLGCGKIVDRFIKGLRMCDNVTLVGFGSNNIEKAREYCERYGASVYGDYDRIMNDPDIDAIYVSNFNQAHYRTVKSCLQHGKHVLCEHPLVPNMDELNELFELAKEKDLERKTFDPVRSKFFARVFYSYRSASIGFRLDALMDGTNPKMIPINIEKITEIRIAGVLIATGTPARTEITRESPIPRMTPMAPPIMESMAASVRNCPRMRRFLAPKAFFNPISRVRSVTETSMMFMTPMPPTSKEMDAIPISMVLVEEDSCWI